MITLRQLRYFRALVRHRHFGKAAAECAVTQPALSQQIREMELALGAQLVERRPSGIALTDAGHEVARRGEAILEEVGALMDAVRRRSSLLAGRLRLGIIPSIAPYLLPTVLPVIHRDHPDLNLEIREALTGVIVEDLLAGRLDALVLALPVSEAGIVTEPLFEDRFLLAARRTPALDRLRAADPAILSREKLLLLEEGHCMRDQALAFCRSANAGIRNELGATSLSTIMQMVANGYGVTLLPEIAVKSEVHDDPRIAVVPFEAPEPKRVIGLAWRSASRNADDFRALARLIADVAEDERAPLS